MKISKYTFLFDIDSTQFYIYSTLSNALVEIDKDTYQYLTKAKTEQLDITASKLNNEIFSFLSEKKFITENDMDSYLLYKSTLIKQRASKAYMHLTIAPTMDCCFNCHYCFEKSKSKKYMSYKTMDSIIKYLNSLNSSPDFKLTWFGGEPLMALSEMTHFYKKLVKEYKKPIISNIITTGYHINRDAINIMQDIGVNQVQITLDGLKETHNKIKHTAGCNDAFEVVLNNVELLLRTSDIHVIFRINLTKSNMDEYVKIYNYLSERFKDIKHKGISPAFVLEKSICNNKTKYFTTSEISEFILNLYKRHQIHSPFLGYPSDSLCECAIRNKMAISFDPEGYAYKCWEVIGNKKYAIGQLNKDGELININSIILNRQLYGADPLEDVICSNCEYLPICNGGCPIQRIENCFDKKHNNCCTHYKGYLEDFLKVHLELKRIGLKNRFD